MPDDCDGLGQTVREHQVLQLLARGYTNRELADELTISIKTASVHVSHILRKLDVTNRIKAAEIAHRLTRAHTDLGKTPYDRPGRRLLPGPPPAKGCRVPASLASCALSRRQWGALWCAGLASWLNRVDRSARRCGDHNDVAQVFGTVPVLAGDERHSTD